MAGHMMFELSFNVAQKAGCAKPEKVGLDPAIAEFVFHQGHVGQRILGL
jgi:hypothetical protein